MLILAAICWAMWQSECLYRLLMGLKWDEMGLKALLSLDKSPSNCLQRWCYIYSGPQAVEEGVIERKEQFLVAQKKKQEELQARKELEMHRQLAAARKQSHNENQLRREDG